MAQPPRRPLLSWPRLHKNRFDDRGIQEPPDESSNGGSSSSQLPTSTVEETSGLPATSNMTTTPSPSPSHPLHSQLAMRPRLYNRRHLQRPLSTPTSSSNWRWSFTTFRNARQQHQQQLHRTRLATLLKRQSYPPPSRTFRMDRHRISYPSNKMLRGYHHEDPHNQGSRRRNRQNSFSALLSSWRMGAGGSSSQLHRLSVRSSMILREDIPTSDLPEVLYDVEDNDEESSLSSFGGSTCSNCANGEPCPHHPPQRHRLYNLKKDGNVLDSKRSTATGVLRSSEKFVRPPTISSLSSSLSVVVLPQRSLQYQQDQHRFSAFWYDGAQGRSGKHQIHVDSLGHVRQSNKQRQDQIQSALFLFGFLIFPLWWIGAWLHCRKHTRSTDPEKGRPKDLGSSSPSLLLANAHVLGQVNCCMTCVSLILIAVMVALGIVLHYWNAKD